MKCHTRGAHGVVAGKRREEGGDALARQAYIDARRRPQNRTSGGDGRGTKRASTDATPQSKRRRTGETPGSALGEIEQRFREERRRK